MFPAYQCLGTAQHRRLSTDIIFGLEDNINLVVGKSIANVRKKLLLIKLFFMHLVIVNGNLSVVGISRYAVAGKERPVEALLQCAGPVEIRIDANPRTYCLSYCKAYPLLSF